MNATRKAETKRSPADDLRRSPMMAHLLDALEAGTDVGHYGRLVFAIVARHFLDEGELVGLLASQPDWDEEKVAEFLAMCASTWCARHPGDRDPGGRAARRPSS